MKIIVRPSFDPQRELDLTNRLVSAIAEELWKLNGGNEHLNWLEAERLLEHLMGDARSEPIAKDLDAAAQKANAMRSAPSKRPFVGHKRKPKIDRGNTRLGPGATGVAQVLTRE